MVSRMGEELQLSYLNALSCIVNSLPCSSPSNYNAAVMVIIKYIGLKNEQ